MDCGHSPSCPVAQVSTSSDVMEDVLENHDLVSGHPLELSSKITALIYDISSQPVQVKSYVSHLLHY